MLSLQIKYCLFCRAYFLCFSYSDLDNEGVRTYNRPMKTTLKLLGTAIVVGLALYLIYLGDHYNLRFSMGFAVAYGITEILEWLKPQPDILIFKVPEPSKN